jgi:U3 small nucleolar RNA-associated protein 14
MMQEVSKEKSKQNEKKKSKKLHLFDSNLFIDTQDNSPSTHLLVPTLDNIVEENSNLYVLQRVVKLPFKVKTLYFYKILI